MVFIINYPTFMPGHFSRVCKIKAFEILSLKNNLLILLQCRLFNCVFKGKYNARRTWSSPQVMAYTINPRYLGIIGTKIKSVVLFCHNYDRTCLSYHYFKQFGNIIVRGWYLRNAPKSPPPMIYTIPLWYKIEICWIILSYYDKTCLST